MTIKTEKLAGCCLIGIQALLLVFFVAVVAPAAQAADAPGTAQKVGPKMPPTEVFFEPLNARQQQTVLYRSHGLGLPASFEQDAVRLSLPRNVASGATQSTDPSSVRLHFVGGSSSARVEGAELLQGISNYFAGSDPKQWRTKVPHFARVVYRGVYPGVDVVFYGEQGRLEYDYVLAPGADPSRLRLEVEGAQLSLSPEGEVIVASGGREVMRLKKPKAFQDREPQRLVAADYVLKGNEVAVRLGKYDHHRQLVVDPALAFATFVMSNCTGVACRDIINGMAVDNTGVYLVGTTTAAVFPSADGQPPVGVTRGANTTFVVKLDPTGVKVLYASFFVFSRGEAIAVDGQGHAVFGGEVFDAPAGTPGFPLTAGSFNGHTPVHCVNCDIPFATELSSDGSSLVFSTLLQADSGNANGGNFVPDYSIPGIAIDSTGAVYVSGFISQFGHGDTSLLPVAATPGAFLTSHPSTKGNAFIMKLNPTGSALDYSTFMGSPSGNASFAIAVDGNGAAYLHGTAGPDFPTTPGAFQTTAPSTAAVVVKLHPDAKTLDYSTFFGDFTTVSGGIAVANNGEAVVSGNGATVPTTPGAICSTGTSGQQRAYLARFNAAGSALVYSTTLCNVANSSSESGGVAVDSSGAAYVEVLITSFNSLPSMQFPLLNPIQGYVPPPALETTSVLKVDSSGALQWGTFFGDSIDHSGDLPSTTTGAIAVDGTGAVYFLSGGVAATPTTPGSFRQILPDGYFQGPYLAKIVPSLGAPVPVLRTSLDFGSVAFGTSSAPNDAIVGNFGDATLPAPTASITGDFSQTSACQNPVPAGDKCAFTVTFTPTAAGLRTGVLTVHFGGALPDQTTALSGTGLAPTVTPSATKITFPPQFPLNTTSPPQQLKITNNGTFALNISNIQTTGDFAQTNTCSSVAIGAFCLVQVTFTPTANGVRNGTVELSDNAVNSPQTVNLVGFGGQAPAVSLNPASIGFGNQNVGSTSAAASVTLTNSGNQTLNVSQISASSDFSQTNNCTSVTAGNTCTLQVSFAPMASGTRNGSVTITSNSFSSPDVLQVTGVALDFSPSPNGPATVTVAAGQTANYGMTVAPVSGFTGTLNFTCTGAPLAANCTVSPSSISLGATSQSVAITVTTTAPTVGHSVALLPRGGPGGWPLLLAAGLTLLLALTLRMRRRIRWVALAPLALMLLLIGCGGGGNSGGGGTQGTPKGTYTITVTGSGNGGSPSHSQNFTLIVN
ncbi:MAG TPA: choice-of-anchor D domain-containing protein [Candidatus Angelobacter sp.]|nr:choice-of-anchor D domain-containing protein [Candidatus Angelobacter sp.]